MIMRNHQEGARMDTKQRIKELMDERGWTIRQNNRHGIRRRILPHMRSARQHAERIQRHGSAHSSPGVEQRR